MKKFIIATLILLATTSNLAQISSVKYALLDNVGKELTPFIYDMITPMGNGYFKVELKFSQKSDNNSLGYGITDAQGRIILQPFSGQDIVSFDPDRNYMIVSRSYGDDRLADLAIFDMNGNEIIPFSEYTVLFPDYNGNIVAGKKLDSPYPQTKYGIIDVLGKVLLPFVYDDIRPIRGNSALYVVTDITESEANNDRIYEPVYDKNRKFKTYVADIHGDSIFSCDNYAMIDCFDKYLHLCDRQSYERKHYVTSLPVPVLSSYAIMDITDGKIIMEYEDYNSLEFHDGLAKRMAGHKVGMVDMHRNEIIPYIYNSIDPFINGLAKVMSVNNKWGIIDNKGQVVLPCTYDAIEYDGGLIRINKKNKWGAANASSSIIIPIKYDAIIDVGSDHIIANKDKDSYLINKDGNIIQKFSFSVVRMLTPGLFEVSDYKSGLNVGAVDYAGVLQIPFNYTRILPIDIGNDAFSDKYLAVEVNKKWGIIDINGKSIIACEYNSIAGCGEKTFIVSRNEKAKDILSW